MKDTAVLWLRTSFLLCVTIIMCSAVCPAGESPTIAELEEQLAGTTGAERLETLNQLANGLCLRSTDSAITYGEEAITLARHLQDLDAEGYALKSIGIAYAVAGNQPTSLEYSAKALAVFEGSDNLIQMAKVLNNMGISYHMLDEDDSAIDYYSKAMAIDEKLDNKKGIARTLGNIGNVQFNRSLYDEALAAHLKALDIETEIGDQDLIASSLTNIGTIYFEQGSFQEALSYQMQALAICEEEGNQHAIAVNTYNIGNIRAELDQDDEALRMFEEAMSAAEEVGNRVLVASSHNAIGSLLTKQSKHKAAAEHYGLARQAYEESGHKSGIADALDNLGICERAFGNSEEAIAYHREALVIREEVGGQRSIANTCNNIGRLLTERGDMKAAEPILLRAYDLSTTINAREIIRDSTWHLSRMEKEKKNYRRALDYLEEHLKVKDQLLDEFTREAVARADARVEAQKRDQEIGLLNKENEIQRLEASRAKLRTNLLLVIIAVAICCLVWLFRRYRYLFAFWKRRSFVGHYKIVDQIASGGMGIVYRAENMVEGSRSFALKVIREEHAADTIVRKRFLHEAAIIDQLDHPHIVVVHERGEHDGRLFMAMELLQGPSLAEVIHDLSHELTLADCLHIMRQLIAVVQQIHVKGVLHRDLKPENIVLIERDGDPYFVKLLDFGLARTQSLTRLTQSGMIVGTIGYLAPEQITDQSCSTASDIYSLGVIFYELVTRQPAFPGSTPVEIIKQILEKPPVEPKNYRPGLTTSLNDLILSMMEKDPTKRPAGDSVSASLNEPQ